AQSIVIDIADSHLWSPCAFFVRQKVLDRKIVEVILDMFPIAFELRGYVLQSRFFWREKIRVAELSACLILVTGEYLVDRGFFNNLVFLIGPDDQQAIRRQAIQPEMQFGVG